MKKHYTHFVLMALLLPSLMGCSKDFLKRYEKRIVDGTWELYEVKTSGWGRSYDLAFYDGRFTFLSSGEVEYRDRYDRLFTGTWDMRRNNSPRNDDDGNVRDLMITVLNHQSQEVLSEYFDEVRFTGTNRFKAWIYGYSRDYIFYFKR